MGNSRNKSPVEYVIEKVQNMHESEIRKLHDLSNENPDLVGIDLLRKYRKNKSFKPCNRSIKIGRTSNLEKRVRLFSTKYNEVELLRHWKFVEINAAHHVETIIVNKFWNIEDIAFKSEGYTECFEYTKMSDIINEVEAFYESYN